MKLKFYSLYALTAFLIAGCAGMNGSEMTVQKLSNNAAELRRSLDETNSRVEELNNKFLLLREKFEVVKEKSESGGFSESSPPEGLKVVRLGEEPAAAPAPGPESPEALYNRGQNLFMEGRYEDARGAFKTLVDLYPADGLSDNALYWTGESYYTEKNFLDALEAFMDTVEKYPEGNKASDALLKAGFSYIELGKKTEGRSALRRLLKRYPGTEAAFKAQKRLKGL